MEQYIYLFLGLFLAVLWLIIYFHKKDLRRKMLKSSLIGGFSGFIAEYWYLRDYWRPPTVLGNAVISVEDFLVGFVIIGISMSIYNFVFRQNEIEATPTRKGTFYILFAIGIVAMVSLPPMGFNSMLVSPISFICFTLFILFQRPDLLKKAILSGILLLAIAFPIYVILFELIAPDYWNKYWLLPDTKLGIRCYGTIPWIEIIWYFSWGSFGGVCYDFYSGTKPVPAKNQEL
ncbi:MAG: hypothetical protein CFE23_10470 [Flavobacterium sp. BFFFF1]|uniref:lycopene cyclase domain-containing protein n=1 Tax=unclassified Flavobacterium TaxID=196869 RepID=UPI000BD81682|nr:MULTISPECIES: lycopene cyclase domain-containing protein [unclassified Flavobacterium]OYU80138.1 MAG: hypothetical protein CFE23_10470 [Flavobacterium sp. BFFFF1]